MQNRGQQQFDLSSGSHEPSTDYAAASRYGQQSLPGLSQPAKRTRQTHVTSGPGAVPQRPPGAPETSKPQQLPMFMSQREISKKYQALDADRQEVYDYREGEATGRPETTEGYPNPKIRTNDRQAPFLTRQDPALVAKSTHYRDFGHPESHAELWDRKLSEAQMSYGEYNEVHQGGSKTAGRTPGYEELMERGSAPQYQGTGHTGTYEHEEMQYVAKKVGEHYEQQHSGSLYGDIEHAMRPGGEGFTGLVHLATGQFGSQGKPQIAGAHHRLAVLGEVAPDRLLPVVHHEKQIDARWGSSKEHFPYS